MKKVLMTTILASFLLAACGDGDDVAEKEIDEKEVATEEGKVPATLSDYDEANKFGTSVGKSDQDFKEITKSNPQEVRNDTTGKWRVITIADNIQIEDYALSYFNEHMGEEEIHFIVNFNNKTTTMLSVYNGILNVEIREYQEKEEHDAKKLGGGMQLKEFYIYNDGDIRDIE